MSESEFLGLAEGLEFKGGRKQYFYVWLLANSDVDSLHVPYLVLP
ncbi:hypothetical protein [Beggiatoa leptomitoformis]|nr:hypothetical protein [Beggiatoa leptomitoformis]